MTNEPLGESIKAEKKSDEKGDKANVSLQTKRGCECSAVYFFRSESRMAANAMSHICCHRAAVTKPQIFDLTCPRECAHVVFPRQTSRLDRDWLRAQPASQYLIMIPIADSYRTRSRWIGFLETDID
jgi:hypothetical protein